MGKFLGHSSLSLAKGFLFILLGGAVFACAVSGAGLFFIGAALLYHFTTSGFFTIPSYLAMEFGFEMLRGVPLMVSGVVSIFIALLFVLAIVSILKIFLSWKNERDLQKSRLYKNWVAEGENVR